MNITIDNQQEVNKVQRDKFGKFIKNHIRPQKWIESHRIKTKGRNFGYKWEKGYNRWWSNVNPEKSGSFQFQNLNKQLSYLLGVYLSDGCVAKHKERKDWRRFSMECIDKDFAGKTQDCINHLTGEKKTIVEYIYPKFPKRIFYRASSSNQNLCFWLEEKTELKTRIPIRIFESEIELKREFLAGLLDGDGWVSKRKDRNAVSIGFAIKDNWIWQVRYLLQKLGVETSDIKIMNQKSGHPVNFFIIKSKSFIKNKLYFSIKRKQERIQNFIYSSETKRVFPLKEMI